jgi:ketosteroid isomerase-like protein
MIADPLRETDAWVAGLTRTIDAKDTRAFLAHLAPDATFTMGNFPPTTGTAAMTAMLDNFFGMLRSLSHVVDDAWSVPGHVVCRGRVTYVRKDGREVSMGFCNVMRIAQGRVADYRVYSDPSPLLAP